MKIKYLIPFLILVLIFGFGLASCSNNNETKISELENEIVDKNIEIENLKSELNITKIQLKNANGKISKLEEEINKPKEESIVETETITTTTENSSIKYGLTEIQRKQAFYELAELQDSISDGDPQRNEKMEEAYLIIAKKYDITKDEMVQIVVEGIEKNWPFPPLE